MTKTIERRRVVSLRKKGYTYSEIKRVIQVSKSSLSLWLKQYPLKPLQLKRIQVIKQKAIERFRETMKMKRINRQQKHYDEQKKVLFPFSKKELLKAGLFLYWGEGNKASKNAISISNTDPSVLKFGLYWLVKSMGIEKKDIKIYMHLYSDMNIKSEITFWSRELNIHRGQFIKPYIKNSKRSNLDQKGFGHGTCNIVVHNTILKEKILMGIKSIADYYARKINSF